MIGYIGGMYWWVRPRRERADDANLAALAEYPARGYGT